MQVLLVCSGQVFPDRTAEVRAPVGRKLPVLLIPQIEEVAVFAVWILAGLFEPFVFVGTVIDHQIHQDVHISFFGFCDQLFHIFHCTEARVDIIVIGNIISFVGQWRRVAGGEPDNVYSQVLQIIKLAYNTGNIADSVPIGIVEALWIDLISYFVMPPFFSHNHTSAFAVLYDLL